MSSESGDQPVESDEQYNEILTENHEVLWRETGEAGPSGYGSAMTEDRAGDEFEAEDYEQLAAALEPTPGVVGRGELTGENVYNALAGFQSGDVGAVSGFKPSGPGHFGHYQTADTLSDLQEAGVEVYVPVADTEANYADVDDETIEFMMADNLLDWAAAGLNLDQAHVYLQSEEHRLGDIKREMQENITIEDAIEAYGMDELDGNFKFLFGGMNQVADLVLPQHPDFDHEYSTMVAGHDQEGHMKMTMNLTEPAAEEDDTFVRTVPSSIYNPLIEGLVDVGDDDESSKASSSEGETSIYVGPTEEQLSLEERIDTGLGKLDTAIDEDPEKVERSAQDHLDVLGIEYDDGEATDILRQELPEFLEEHRDRRIKVFDYAREKAQGGEPEQPDFWPENGEAQVPQEERNETEWHEVVAAMDGEVIE
ncbi:MAG: hypothetical protein ABEJ98_01505 [Candidatus Nanohaloarchaea archaeon]